MIALTHDLNNQHSVNLVRTLDLSSIHEEGDWIRHCVDNDKFDWNLL